MEIKIDFSDVKKLNRGIKSYGKRNMTVVHRYAKSCASSLERKAKREARWQDRTGQARNSIKGSYIQSGDMGTIILEGYAKSKYNKDYFIHLEYARNGRFSILRPVIKKSLPRISKTLSNRLSKVKIMSD